MHFLYLNTVAFIYYKAANNSSPFSDDQERLKFLTELTTKVNKPSSQDAYVYALVAASDVKLRLQDFSGARKDLDIAESILDTFDSVEIEVHATFYRINASYYQVGPPFPPPKACLHFPPFPSSNKPPFHLEKN